MTVDLSELEIDRGSWFDREQALFKITKKSTLPFS